MDNVVYKLRLEATKPGRQGTVHVVKDDTGTRIIEATITSNGKPLVFDGATVALWANVAGSDQFIAGEILEDKTTARVVLPTTIVDVPGEFDAELRYIETASAHVLTSAKIVIIVEPNLYDSEAVEAQDNFDALASYAAMAYNAVEHYPRISSTTGNWEVYDAENEEWDDTGVKADGEDGVSPNVEIESITGGHRVTITDADHPTGQTFDVMDGEDGEDGKSISQIIKGSSVGLVDTYYIVYTDGGGMSAFTVTNGKDGKDGKDGANGQDGADGQDGYTPVRGVDYWTAADQAAIVADVLAALPTAEGGAY